MIQDDDSDLSEYNPNKRFVDIKLIDRSFTNLGYLGYGDGI